MHLAIGMSYNVDKIQPGTARGWAALYGCRLSHWQSDMAAAELIGTADERGNTKSAMHAPDAGSGFHVSYWPCLPNGHISGYSAGSG